MSHQVAGLWLLMFGARCSNPSSKADARREQELAIGSHYLSFLTPPICPLPWQPSTMLEVDTNADIEYGVTFMLERLNVPMSPLEQE